MFWFTILNGVLDFWNWEEKGKRGKQLGNLYEDYHNKFLICGGYYHPCCPHTPLERRIYI